MEERLDHAAAVGHLVYYVLKEEKRGLDDRIWLEDCHIACIRSVCLAVLKEMALHPTERWQEVSLDNRGDWNLETSVHRDQQIKPQQSWVPTTEGMDENCRRIQSQSGSEQLKDAKTMPWEMDKYYRPEGQAWQVDPSRRPSDPDALAQDGLKVARDIDASGRPHWNLSQE